MLSKESGSWLSEPPSWPLIRGSLSLKSHNLLEYLECDDIREESEDSNGYGTVYRIEKFIRWCRELENAIKSQQQTT